jgi:hypothetical protein
LPGYPQKSRMEENQDGDRDQLRMKYEVSTKYEWNVTYYLMGQCMNMLHRESLTQQEEQRNERKA